MYALGQRAALVKLGFSMNPNLKAVLQATGIGAAAGTAGGILLDDEHPLRGAGYGALAGGALGGGAKLLHNTHLDHKIKGIQAAAPYRRPLEEVEAELSPLRSRRAELKQRIGGLGDANERAAAAAEEQDLLKKIKDLNMQKAPYSPEERAAYNAVQHDIPELEAQKGRLFPKFGFSLPPRASGAALPARTLQGRGALQAAAEQLEKRRALRTPEELAALAAQRPRPKLDVINPAAKSF